jgi:hypothetical protein
MPDDGLHPFGKRGHPVGFDRRNDDHDIAVTRSIAAAPTDNSKDPGRTLFGVTLTLRSASPPPTEKISNASLSLSLLTSSQPANTVSQPSSLVRAVSSETLSIGE